MKPLIWICSIIPRAEERRPPRRNRWRKKAGAIQPRHGRSIPESSPVGSSSSNGVIGRGTQSVEGQARKIKSALEAHLGTKIPSDRSIVPWMIEYASVLLNRGQVGEDGKRSYERLEGNSPRRLVSNSGREFSGEPILNEIERTHWAQSGKPVCFWFTGPCQATALQADRMVPSDPVLCIESQKKNDGEIICHLSLAYPGSSTTGYGEAEEVLLDATPPVPSMRPTTSPSPPAVAREPTVRRSYVETASVDPKEGGMGFAVGCPGCASIILGKPGRGIAIAVA